MSVSHEKLTAGLKVLAAKNAKMNEVREQLTKQLQQIQQQLNQLQIELVQNVAQHRLVTDMLTESAKSEEFAALDRGALPTAAANGEVSEGLAS